jgi:hypothetical protein
MTEVPSELETFLKKPTIPRTDTFDILSWWKSNSMEYPTLSRIAHDVLAVPASNVASESAFSMWKKNNIRFSKQLNSTKCGGTHLLARLDSSFRYNRFEVI